MSKSDDKQTTSTPAATAQRKMKFNVPDDVADAIRKCGQVVNEKKLRQAVEREVFAGYVTQVPIEKGETVGAMTPDRVKEIAKGLIDIDLDALS
jgi:hypothetical protein